jgi:hypothetical protein
MLPNMSAVLTAFERPVTVKTVTKTTVNFVTVETVTTRTQQCVVQVADKEKLNSGTIDWSLEYLLVHSAGQLQVGEYVEFNGMDYKIISRGAWSGYGYTEVICEETKRPLL